MRGTRKITPEGVAKLSGFAAVLGLVLAFSIPAANADFLGFFHQRGSKAAASCKSERDRRQAPGQRGVGAIRGQAHTDRST